MKRLLYLLAFIVLYSCKGKVTSTDIIINGGNVYYQEKPYSGKVWSKDGKSAVLEVSAGNILKLTIFHKNGKPAYVVTKPRDSFEKVFYDEDGNEMERYKWKGQYGDLRRDIGEEFPGL